MKSVLKLSKQEIFPIGLILIFPPSRKLILKSFSKKYETKKQKKDFIEGEFEDKDDQ